MIKRNIRHKHYDNGFTLIELLVSVLIFSLISITSYTALNNMLNTNELLDKQTKILNDLQTLFSFMSRELQQMANRHIRDNYGDISLPITGTRSVIEFTRTGWQNPGGFKRSALQRIGYMYEDNEIKRLTWKVLDRAQDSNPIKKSLIQNIDEFEMRYLNSNNDWQYDWPGQLQQGTNTDALPIAVEVSISIEGWGDINRLFLTSDQ